MHPASPVFTEDISTIEYKQGADGLWIGPTQDLIHDPAGAAFLQLQLGLIGHRKQQSAAKAQLDDSSSTPPPLTQS